MQALLAFLGILSCSLLYAAPSYNLIQSFEAALKKSETLAIQDEAVAQAEERYRQLRGNLFPNVSAVGSYLRQDDPESSLGRSFAPSDQTTAKLTATQPLFRGLREFAALRQSDESAEAQRHARENATLLLFTDVAQSFYDVLSFEKDLKNLETEIGLNKRRVAELGSRRKIGRSRESEVLTVEASVATLEAQAEQVRGQLAASREVFSFLTGFPRDVALYDSEGSPAKVEPLGHYLKNIEQRPDIQAEIRRSEAADEGVSIARGAHLPTIDLVGNYYFKRPSGALEDVKWDVQVLATLPIFSGGATQSQVRQASSAFHQSELSLGRVRRAAEQEIRSRYQTFLANQSQLERLRLASELSAKNLSLQQKEYRLGLVTNLDVIQAIASSQQTQRALDRSRFNSKLEFLRLEAAIGRRPFRSKEGYQ